MSTNQLIVYPVFRVHINASNIVNMEKLMLSFLKPQRATYNLSDLGTPIFENGQRFVKRSDLQIQKVPFSYYEVDSQKPTILYLHSYNSSRLEVISLLPLLLQNSFNVAVLQFQRVSFNENQQRMQIDPQGMISFGFYECEQVNSVVRWIQKHSREKIYLWGRSMGAVTALLYQQKYGRSSALVLDSPFHSLREIFVSQFASLTRLPRFLGQSTVFLINFLFKKLLRFDIDQMDLLPSLQINSPAFIVANSKDSLAGPSSSLIYQKCKGQRKILYSQAEHSGSRERAILQQIISHLNNLQKPLKQYSSGKLLKNIKPFLISQNFKTEDSQAQETVKKSRPTFIKLMQSQKTLSKHMFNN